MGEEKGKRLIPAWSLAAPKPPNRYEVHDDAQAHAVPVFHLEHDAGQDVVGLIVRGNDQVRFQSPKRYRGNKAHRNRVPHDPPAAMASVPLCDVGCHRKAPLRAGRNSLPAAHQVDIVSRSLPLLRDLDEPDAPAVDLLAHQPVHDQQNSQGDRCHGSERRMLPPTPFHRQYPPRQCQCNLRDWRNDDHGQSQLTLTPSIGKVPRE